MPYVDGFVLAVPDAQRETYRHFAAVAAEVFKSHGALRVVECWADDVPDGKLTSFPMAVKLAAGESVVFAWIEWPSRAVRDEGMKRTFEDPRMATGRDEMPFDGQRMIFGGFETIVDL